MDHHTQYSDQLLSQDYQENNDFKATSLYCIGWYRSRSNLIAYNIETDVEEEIVLNSPEPLDLCTSITQLPRNELFCYGNYERSGIALIVDSNYKIRILPPGTPCANSSGIYCNNSVYCFGGEDNGLLPLSRKFDLSENRWINLTSMPITDYMCSSVLFNGYILFIGYYNRKIFLYSIEINSFSAIPYDFAMSRKKVLITSERLYLIALDWVIYESEIGDEYNWSWISNAIAIACNHVYCLYNKEAIYMATDNHHSISFYKFNLGQKLWYDLKNKKQLTS